MIWSRFSSLINILLWTDLKSKVKPDFQKESFKHQCIWKQRKEKHAFHAWMNRAKRSKGKPERRTKVIHSACLIFILPDQLQTEMVSRWQRDSGMNILFRFSSETERERRRNEQNSGRCLMILMHKRSKSMIFITERSTFVFEWRSDLLEEYSPKKRNEDEQRRCVFHGVIVHWIDITSQLIF